MLRSLLGVVGAGTASTTAPGLQVANAGSSAPPSAQSAAASAPSSLNVVTFSAAASSRSSTSGSSAPGSPGGSFAAGSTAGSTGATLGHAALSSGILKKQSFYGSDDRVVIQLGTHTIRAGFSLESSPRQTLIPFVAQSHPHAVLVSLAGTALASDANMVQIYGMHHQPSRASTAFLQSTLRTVYERILLTDAKQKRIVVCEPLFVPIDIKRALAALLFARFGVPAITFLPSPFAALLSTGFNTGLVVESEQCETVVLPVYDGVPLTAYAQSVPLAGDHVTARLKQLIKDHGRLVSSSAAVDDTSAATGSACTLSFALEDVVDSLGSWFWDNLTLRLVVAPALPESHVGRRQGEQPTADQAQDQNQDHDQLETATEPTIQVPAGPGQTIVVPAWIRREAVNALFEGDDEGESMQSCVLNSLLKCPLAIRGELIQNVLVAGATFMIPGLEQRLRHHIMAAPDAIPGFSSLKGLVAKTRFMHSPFQPALRAWIGGSLAAAVKMKTTTEVTREEFAERPIVPDWSTTPPPHSTAAAAAS
ncbi:actin-domain-containing protein [Entophlyctis helioformis]|nr:actin-domain-containing protein [Entophlyctis helioformis]